MNDFYRFFINLLFISSSYIGDAVLSTGILSHIISQYPGAKITIACGKLPSPLFKNVPGLERIITITKKPYNLHWLDLYRQVFRTRWDLVIDMRSSGISYLLRARKRYIYRSSRNRNIHKVEDLANSFGISVTQAAPTMWVSTEDERQAAEIMPEGPDYIIFAPAANWRGKEWPVKYFSELAEELFRKNNNYRFVILAGAGDRERISNLLSALPEDSYVDLIGKVDLSLIPALLRRSRLFVGNDSGLMHISAATRIPTIGIYGPTDDKVYGPWGEKNIVVRSAQPWKELFGSYSGTTLMNDIAPQKVLEAVNTMLERNASLQDA